MQIQQMGPGEIPDEATSWQVPMRDGVELATDVYLPATGEPRPAFLVRLPYDKNGIYCFMPLIARYVAERGYAVVIQDVRGKFRSGGETVFARNEAADGYDTIDWIARQEWCDGDVVMWGDSYFGMTQLAAVVSGHPALKAISPRLTGTQLSTVIPYADGSTDVDQFSRRLYFATMYVDNDAYMWPVNPFARPLLDTFKEFFEALGRRSESFDIDLEAPASLRSTTVDALVESTPVPTLFTIGWYDNCAVWSWHDVERLLADSRWADQLHLRLEAIDHENYRFAHWPIAPENDHAMSETARDAMFPRILDPALEFFDSVLGRAPKTTAKVTYEVCHGEWQTAEQWPPSGTGVRTLYARPGDDARSGTLVDLETGEDGEISWTSDGVDLVPSLTENPFAMVHGLSDVSAHAERPDVATLDSAPHPAGLTLAGPVRVSGELTTDQSSADVFARLLDLAPDGTATLIVRGQVQLNDIDGPRPFTIGLLHTAYFLKPGHRLRLHLGSTDFPEFIFNTGDGTDPWTAKQAAQTTARIRTGGGTGLRLDLHVADEPSA
ncbi:CocE/NonD family hydrolase [Streptomyces sp. NPDC048282]|uniref:CocE/NonD family hydrolase n=1 Tax=Streptomyces sp. NPDC048282 TaxID=3365528 RepID=UPI00371CD8AA